MVTFLSMAAASSQQESGEDIRSVEDEMISSLPKGKGWFTHHLHLYQGFWYYHHALQGVLFAQQHFNALPTDILLATNPKCGTTWLKSLAFAIKNRAAAAAPNDQSNHSITQLLTASPHALVESLEFEIFERDSLKEFETLPPPRLVGTHIPFSSLPESVCGSGCRVVYVCREPKDMFVSTWHFIGKLNHVKEVPLVSLQEAFELFCQGVSPFRPYWDHVLGYYKASLEWPERVLFLKYEDMKRDTLNHVKRLANFLGYPFSSEEEEKGVVEEIIQLCSFENMSNLEVTKNGKLFGVVKNDIFYRKGEVGDSKNHLTVEMMKRVDAITMEKFRGFELGY